MNQSPQNDVTRVSELIPRQLREDSQQLISFIESYYSWLNENGAHAQIRDLLKNRSLGGASEDFLSAICDEIAKNVPNPAAIDKRLLMSKIVKFYESKGSQNSVVAFFRIFFDEIVDLFYPREFLFTTSEGKWNGSGYDNRKSFVSDVNRIRDGDYWQEFSYVIKSSLSANVWSEYYKKLVHPAGLKFFAALIAEIALRNEWFRDMNYTTEDPDSDFSWLSAIRPVHASNEWFIPRSQPGWLDGGRRTFKFQFDASLWNGDETNAEEFTRFVEVVLTLLVDEASRQADRRRHDELLRLKFMNSVEMGDYFQVSAQQFDLAFDAASSKRSAFSTTIVITDLLALAHVTVGDIEDPDFEPGIIVDEGVLVDPEFSPGEVDPFPV